MGLRLGLAVAPLCRKESVNPSLVVARRRRYEVVEKYSRPVREHVVRDSDNQVGVDVGNTASTKTNAIVSTYYGAEADKAPMVSTSDKRWTFWCSKPTLTGISLSAGELTLASGRSLS